MKRTTEFERLNKLVEIERTFWSQPQTVLAGMDEVGRGPLAGPVVAACVLLPSEPLILYVNDSKKLTEKRRHNVYEKIISLADDFALGWVEAQIIDKINILEATRLAFKYAYEAMQMKVTAVLVDALQNLDIPVQQHAYVRGDAISYLIAAASVVAKVERDRYMEEQHDIYPVYGFCTNKGYGTAEHVRALKKHGPCPLHRRTFLARILASA
ncbi:MAG: ribonuclease HII [Clostridiales bacterium]|jgi:ribonuclease HII|nr:ribonuclease HII [Clostridiales bacterium]